jgi:hypothetical protein
MIFDSSILAWIYYAKFNLNSLIITVNEIIGWNISHEGKLLKKGRDLLREI